MTDLPANHLPDPPKSPGTLIAPHQRPRSRLPLRLAPRRAISLRRGVILGLVIAVIGLVTLYSQLFAHTRLYLTDLLYTPSPISNKVVIVAIDDLSLGAYGRSVATWPRARHAELLNVLSKAGARVVAFDALFINPSDDDPTFAAAIKQAADSPARTRTILAISGSGAAAITPNNLISYPTMSQPSAPLIAAGATTGVVDVFPDSDATVRTVPLAIQAQGQTWFSLSAAAFLAYLRIPAVAIDQVVSIQPGQIDLTSARQLPVDQYGALRTDFFGGPGTFPVYSYQAVHDGLIDPAAFKDKIVLVGALNAAGIADYYLTPIAHNGTLLSGVEIHANVIETLLQNRPLTPLSPLDSGLLVVAVALVTGAVFSQLRWYWILIALVGVVGGLLIVASVLFSVDKTVVSLFDPFLVLIIVTFGALIVNIFREYEYRAQTQRLLDSTSALLNQRLLLADVEQQIGIEVERLLGYRNCAIWLWSEEQARLEPGEWRTALTDSALQESLENAARQLAKAPDAGAVDTDSGRLVPLFFQQVFLGILGGFDRSSRASANPIQQTLFNLFAQNAAPALATARSYTEQQRQKSLSDSILGSVPDAVVVLDAAHAVIRRNPTADRLFSSATATPSFRDLLSTTALPPDQVETLDTMLAHATIAPAEMTIDPRTFTVQGAPLQFGQQGWVVAFHDISALKELETLRTRMMRMASHDLKNPLSVILGYSSLMLATVTDDKQKRMLTTVQNNGQKMLSLITDLLDVEKIQSGALNLTPVELHELLGDLVEEYRPQAEQKSQSITFKAVLTRITIQADLRQFSEAISNLIGNAIKYTPNNGAIQVELSQDDEAIHIAVIDNGYGIPKEQQGRLFEAFYRVRTADTANIPGTGLGLSLVKAVIEAHKGSIRLESEEGQGSRFLVDLPPA